MQKKRSRLFSLILVTLLFVTATVPAMAAPDEANGQPASYTVVFYAETADNTTTPLEDQTGPRRYDYLGVQEMEGISGAVAAFPSDSDKLVASFNPELAEYITLNDAKTEAANAGVVVNADGSTIVNVYYDRNIYSVHLSNRPYVTAEAWSWVYDDIAYDDDTNPYVITAKYGDYIAAEWPAEGPTPPAGQFYTWLNPNSTSSIASKRLQMNSEIAYGTVSNPLVLRPQSVTNGTVVNLQYLLQAIDIEAYLVEDVLTQNIIIAGGTGVTGKLLQGFTLFRDEFTGSEARFYYTRNNYSLTLHNGPESQQFQVPYEKSLAAYYEIPEPPEQYLGYTFAGWYSSPVYYEETYVDLSDTLMPAANLSLFAKWEK